MEEFPSYTIEGLADVKLDTHPRRALGKMKLANEISGEEDAIQNGSSRDKCCLAWIDRPVYKHFQTSNNNHSNDLVKFIG